MDEAQAAEVLHLFQLELEDGSGGCIEALYFLLGEAEGFDEFDVAEALRRGPGEGGGFFDDFDLNLLDAFAEYGAQCPENWDCQEERRGDGPVDIEGVDHDEDDADEGAEEQVDADLDEFFHVGADLLQFAQRFAAALILEDLVGQAERMPDAIGVHLRA